MVPPISSNISTSTNQTQNVFKNSLKNLYERTLSCINENLYNNFVMLRSYSDDYLDYSAIEPHIRGERYPLDLFTVRHINELGLPFKTGLILAYPDTTPTFGQFIPEWSDIIFSVMAKKVPTIGREYSWQDQENLKFMLNFVKNNTEMQKRLVELKRTKGILFCARYLEEMTRLARG